MQPFAAAGRNEKTQDRRIDADDQRIKVLGGYADEGVADLIGHGHGRRRSSPAVKMVAMAPYSGNWISTPAVAGTALATGAKKLPRPPMQQQSGHQEHEVVGIEVRDREDRALAGEFVEQPSGREQHEKHRQQRRCIRAIRRAFAAAGAFDLIVAHDRDPHRLRRHRGVRPGRRPDAR